MGYTHVTGEECAAVGRQLGEIFDLPAQPGSRAAEDGSDYADLYALIRGEKGLSACLSDWVWLAVWLSVLVG